VVLEVAGDIRDRFFDIYNLEETFCKGVTKYVLISNSGFQIDDVFTIDE